MNKTKWIIFAVVVVAIFGLVIFFNRDNTPKYQGDTNKIITSGIADHVLGPKDQKVTLIEYGDYECPGCGSMYATIKGLTDAHSDHLTFIFRNFPLTNIHPNALAAATAAEAAGLQGKYFEMHDKLYENQQSWANASVSDREAIFTGYAADLGLNTDQFKKDLASDSVASKISRDRSIGATLGVNSTPTFVLNGTMITGADAVNADSLTQRVTDAINKAFPVTK